MPTDEEFRAFWSCGLPEHHRAGAECWTSRHMSTEAVAKQALKCHVSCKCWRHRISGVQPVNIRILRLKLDY